jgi:hypothetical protein
MSFVQIVEFTTTDIDAVHELDEEWMRATEGKRTVTCELVARDRNNPDRYFALVFFDSYESAMRNSELPETQALAAKYREVTQDVAYHDLDVLEERS